MMSAKKVTEKTIPECVIQSLYGGDQYTGDKPWMQFDTWDVELACKLITLNYPVDLEGSGWDSAKKWPLDKWGRGSLTGVMHIFDRALGIAKSSIHTGKIKEHDTPANWIKWAQEKRYDVARLMPADAAVTLNKASTETTAQKVSKGKAGRPKTIDKKVAVVRDMIAKFERAASTTFKPQALCGSAADLLDACVRFEKSNKIKPLIFSTSQDTFNHWLKRAGYSFPTGRTPDVEKNYWTQLVVKVSV